MRVANRAEALLRLRLVWHGHPRILLEAVELVRTMAMRQQTLLGRLASLSRHRTDLIFLYTFSKIRGKTAVCVKFASRNQLKGMESASFATLGGGQTCNDRVRCLKARYHNAARRQRRRPNAPCAAYELINL